MINRITNAGIGAAAQRNLHNAMQRLATAQTKAASLEAISRPSDDPGGTATAMAVRSELRANEQYSRNVQDATGWLATADTALGKATTALNRVRDLTVRGANDGSMSPANKEAIAIELESLHDTLLDAANTRYMGRSIFAGTSNSAAAFQKGPDGTYAFTGSGGTVERRTGANTTVRVDADGMAAFGPGKEDGETVFNLITSIITDLRSGTSISGRIGDVDAKMRQVRDAQTSVGVRHASVLSAADALRDDAVALEGRRSAVEDIDLGSAALDLKMQEVAYQAALSASARTLQPTLMDFLR